MVLHVTAFAWRVHTWQLVVLIDDILRGSMWYVASRIPAFAKLVHTRQFVVLIDGILGRWMW